MSEAPVVSRFRRVPRVATTQEQRLRIHRTPTSRVLQVVALAAIAYVPLVLTERAIFGRSLSNVQLLGIGLNQVNTALVMAIAAVALNYLTGFAGLVSVGSAAFFAVGVLGASLTGTIWGWPFPLAIASAGLLGTMVGIVGGLPSLRVRGLYLLLATLAVHFIVHFVFVRYEMDNFGLVGVPFEKAKIGPLVIDSHPRWYFVLVAVLGLVLLFLRNTLRTRGGRSFVAIHDNEIAAAGSGINVGVERLRAFAITSGVTAVAGGLFGYLQTNVASEAFSLTLALNLVAMMIIGGMGSLGGSIVGAFIWTLMPSVISTFAREVGSDAPVIGGLLQRHQPQVVNVLLGATVIVLLIFEPKGIVEVGRRIARRLRTWPLHV